MWCKLLQTSGRRSYFCRIFNQGSQALSPLGLHRVAPNTSLPKPSWAVRPFQRGNRQCLAAAMVKTWGKKQVWVHHHGHYYRETSPLLSVKVYDDFPFWSPSIHSLEAMNHTAKRGFLRVSMSPLSLLRALCNCVTNNLHSSSQPIGSMVLLYMVTWMPSIYPSHVSIYTSTMDPMGNGLIQGCPFIKLSHWTIDCNPPDLHLYIPRLIRQCAISSVPVSRIFCATQE